MSNFFLVNRSRAVNWRYLFIFLTSAMFYATSAQSVGRNAPLPVTAENIVKAVKGVTFKNFKTRAENLWELQYSANLSQIAKGNGNLFAEQFAAAIRLETLEMTLPVAMPVKKAVGILCAPLEENESPEFKGAVQLVRCPLNEGYSYKKTAFGDYLDPLGPNQGDPRELEDPFTGPKLSNGFRALLAVNVNPPSPRLFKAWLMSEIAVFAIENSQNRFITIHSTGVKFDEKLIQSYLQVAFIDRANALLNEVESDDNRRFERLGFNTKTRAYPDGVSVGKVTGRVSSLNFNLIFGDEDDTGGSVGPGTFRLGGVVIDRSSFANRIGSWSFPLQLFYYFKALEIYRNEIDGYGLAEFYIDLFSPVGTLWLAWGEVFAYPGSAEVRSIGYWRKILEY